MKDFLTSVARTHLALIASSVVIFAIDTTPSESRFFQAAEAEAAAIGRVADKLHEEMSFDPNQPKNYVDFFDDTKDTESLMVKKYASKFINESQISPGFRYSGRPGSILPTSASSLNEILISLRRTPLIMLPAPDVEILHLVFRELTARKNTNALLPCEREGKATKCGELTGDMILMGVRAERLIPDDTRPASEQLSGVSRNSPDHRLIVDFGLTNGPDSPRSTVSYTFPYRDSENIRESHLTITAEEKRIALAKQEIAKRTPLSYLKDTLCGATNLIGLLLPNKWFEYGWCQNVVMLIPHLDARINEVGSLTPQAAAQQFHDKAVSTRQKISLLGQSVDENAARYLGPAIILALAWHLLSETEGMRRTLARYRALGPASLTETELLPAWIGLHPNLGSRVYVALTIVVLPAFAVAASALRSDEPIGLSDAVIACELLLTVFCGKRTLRQLAMMRIELRSAYIRLHLYRRRIRRVEVLKKVAARREKRESKKLDDLC